jgi:hypothetical protein
VQLISKLSEKSITVVLWQKRFFVNERLASREAYDDAPKSGRANAGCEMRTTVEVDCDPEQPNKRITSTHGKKLRSMPAFFSHSISDRRVTAGSLAGLGVCPFAVASRSSDISAAVRVPQIGPSQPA